MKNIKPLRLDKETKVKLLRSALISLGGFLIIAIPLLLPPLQESLKGNPYLVALLVALGTWLTNTIHEWRKQQRVV